MPPQNEDTGPNAATSMPTHPPASRTWSRWSQRALVSLGFGAIVLGALAWRARTPVETSARSPSAASARPSTPDHRPAGANPMAGLPAPPPSEELELDPLGAVVEPALGGFNAFSAAVTAYYGTLVHGEGDWIDLSLQECAAGILECMCSRTGR